MTVWAGLPWFTILVAAAAAIAAYELSKMAHGWGDKPFIPIAVIGAGGLVVAGHFQASAQSVCCPNLPPQVIASAALSGLSLVWILSRPYIARRPSTIVTTLAATFFVGGILFHAPLLRELSQGLWWVLFLLLVTFATDTGAFFVGRAIGKRKLAPAISPGKTVEGAVGGLIAAVGVGLLAVEIFNLRIGLPPTIGLSALVGISGQIGDLAESRIKRIAGVKDSGRLFPGHGGILDRLDSIVFNLLVVYYFVVVEDILTRGPEWILL